MKNNINTNISEKEVNKIARWCKNRAEKTGDRCLIIKKGTKNGNSESRSISVDKD